MPKSYQPRDLRETDVAQVVDLYRAAYGDARPIGAADLLSRLADPAITPGSLRVLEHAGSVVGYGDIEVSEQEVALEVAAPGHWEHFLEWAEATAKEVQASRVRVLSYGGPHLLTAARRRGYILWRSSYTMRADLRVVTQGKPSIPPGMVLRPFRSTDAAQLVAALNESFANDPFFHHATAVDLESYQGIPGFDFSLWRLAWDGTEVAGFVLAYPERAGDKELGWIHSLGVRPRSRRRGVGTVLLWTAFTALRDRGIPTVELGVDAANETGALSLYERMGMHIVAQQAENWTLRLD